jgi:23S rRNA (uracil1939-C5)-methyltransferase
MTKRPKKQAKFSNAPVTIEIEKLVYGGDGLARREGATYFLPFVLAGETVRVRPVESHKNFVRAEALEILRPSPDRVSPPCPHFTVCGGCHYQHIGYERQLEAKREVLLESLARIGHVRWEGPVELHASPPFGYRNRAQWKVRPLRAPRGGNGPGDRSLAIGYFQAGSNRLCAVRECAVLAPPLAAALESLRATLDADDLPSTIREIQAFTAPDGALLMNVSLSSFSESPRRLAATIRTAVPNLRSLLLEETPGERMELDGPGHVNYPVGGFEYRVGHMSFFQVNRFLVDAMTETVTAGAAGGLAVDLYAGVGLFSVPLGRKFQRVVSVEADPAAARDLEANVSTAGVPAQAVNADAAKFLADWNERPELLVLDPPRSGAPPELLAALGRLKPSRIAYLSCDPSTLARDLGELVKSGFRIASMHLFDVFPQTYHIETLVQLTTEP